MAFTRISSASIFNTGLAQILRKQSDLLATQDQLSTGRRVITAADDPLAAGSATRIDRTLAQNSQFGRNADVLANRLNLQESLLTEAGESLQRLREMAIQAANAPLSSSDRQSLAAEVEQIRQRLFGLANSVDSAGRYLFGGAKDDTRPFLDAAAGVQYIGDQVQRSIDVAPELALTDAEPGSEVWMRIPTGDGRLRVTADTANTGSGLLGAYSIVDASAWSGQPYSVVFTAPGSYEVRDAAATVVATGTFQPGDTLQFSGLSLQINGQPAAGDRFELETAPRQDLFTTLDAFEQTLNGPATTSVERWRQQNQIQQALADLATAGDHFLDIRAAGGARLATLDAAGALRESLDVTFKTTLSDLRDVNIAEAASRLAQQQTALDAAQLTFNRVASLSLFNYLR